MSGLEGLPAPTDEVEGMGDPKPLGGCRLRDESVEESGWTELHYDPLVLSERTRTFERSSTCRDGKPKALTKHFC